MDAELTSASAKAADSADRTFAEWLRELPDGPLRDHIAELADTHRQLDETQLRLVALFQERHGCLYGTWNTDDRTEIVGPYISAARRRQGLGSQMLDWCFTVSWAVPEMFLFAPGTELWRAEKLEPHGFEPHSPVLKDGAGDHQTFEVTLERRANRHLRRVGEPRGSGPWVVQLYNDDTTPFPTVIFALRRVLDVNERTAFEYASLVHSAGIASVRYCRSEWGANRIAARIRAIARRDSFPLTVCVERRL